MLGAVAQGGPSIDSGPNAVAQGAVDQGEVVVRYGRIIAGVEGPVQVGDCFEVTARLDLENAQVGPHPDESSIDLQAASEVAFREVETAEGLPGERAVGVTLGDLRSYRDTYGEGLDGVHGPGHSRGTETAVETRPERLRVHLAGSFERLGGVCDVARPEVRQAEIVKVPGGPWRVRRGTDRRCAGEVVEAFGRGQRRSLALERGARAEQRLRLVEPVRIPIYDETRSAGNGNNLVYTVIAFAPVRILKVVFTGKNRYVIIQPAPPPADPNQVWGGIRNGPLPEQFRLTLIR